MKFTIKRSKWLRGEGNAMSKLLRGRDGKMCCLGQAAQQCGVPENKLLNLCDLSEMDDRQLLPANFQDPDQEYWISDAYRINDDMTIDDDTREKSLRTIASANGHEFEFID